MWTRESTLKSIETKKRNGTLKGGRGAETRRRNDPNNLAAKKAWETRRKNGNDKHTEEAKEKMRTVVRTSIGALKAWETRRKNGTDKIIFNRNTKKAWETRRKNGTDNWTNTEEFKEKQRIIRQKEVEKNGYSMRIGNNETKLLDEFEQKYNIKILRQYDTGIGFTLDGYCPEWNMGFEVYEPAHYASFEKIIKDKQRLGRICRHMKCGSIIINENSLQN